ncbi:hypothetical protein [Bacillus sonorensis]|uniref:hypothetical protein n=1 Tax=Bacillus sonorensis TaxID=119858 RepID=UPI0022820F4B|nr:hypothetical protein [Bacillus sonorensis]MCY8025675.1 hypothetical protein [Bacillus sonorensis]MCY8087615.1 hypothetical protein [Bacillus sonorensis]MCY8271435.1 hypothetical protein [Bacillus sonorensis]MCY8603971.1 hypothetical protein [Bacillus sonorensis]
MKILVVKCNGVILTDEQREKIREKARKAIEKGIFVADENVDVYSIDVEHLKSTELNDQTQKAITDKSPSVYTEAITNIGTGL